MASRSTWLIAAVAAAALVGLGFASWYALWRTEEIPEQLDPVALEPDAIVIPGIGGAPPLEVAKLRGKTAFFVMVGVQTAKSNEGERLNRALNRWDFPETTQGYVIGDAEGFGLFSERISKTMGHFATEVRYPLYVDYEGAFIQTFALPKGHHAFVVLGPDGAVAKRVSGGIEDESELQSVRELLGGEEPPPGPPAPAFTLGEMSDAACAQRPCALIFSGTPVRLDEVPGPDNGFEGDDDARYAQMKIPRIRNVQLSRHMHLKEALGVVIGEVDTRLRFVGWTLEPQADDVREAFGLAAGEPAVIIVAGGRIAMKQTGLVPLYRWGLAADLLAIDNFNDRRPPKE